MPIVVQRLLDPGFAGRSLFHPKAAQWADGRLLMTVQEIAGSDFYGPVLESLSSDRGYSWGVPEPVPPFADITRPDGIVERTCDVVPDVDPASGRLVAIGHNVFVNLAENRFIDTTGFAIPGDRDDRLRRRGVYAVRDEAGAWGPRRYFDPAEFADYIGFCGGCAQKLPGPGGEWLIPFTVLRSADRPARFVVVYRARFDGEAFELLDHGEPLTHDVGRGLLEPSLVAYGGETFITLRAEDERGYVARSADGIHYDKPRAWHFDDGEPLITSSTQQHWGVIAGRLYLFYVRRDGENGKVVRHRAPLYMAEVDLRRLCLVRATERTVLPMDGDWRRPDTVSLSGNFMPLGLDDSELLVFDGQCRPFMGYQGFAVVARVFAPPAGGEKA